MTAATRSRGKARNDDVRANLANRADHVPQEAFLTPEAKRLLGPLAVAKVDYGRKFLFSPVDATRLKQFVGPDHSHQVALFGADPVLPAFAASSREIHRAEVHAAGEVRHDSGVLIIRMGTEHQDCAHRVQTVKQFVQLGGAVQGRRLTTQ